MTKFKSILLKGFFIFLLQIEKLQFYYAFLGKNRVNLFQEIFYSNATGEKNP